MIAVITLPTSWMSPVPTRLRTPSASVMMREMRTPVFVESKYEIGRRSTCACTRLRISVIARCAAMLTTCDSANDVPALDDRRDDGERGERHQQAGRVLADDVVDEELRREREHESGDAVDHHQAEADRERHAVLGDQLPRLFPRAGLVVLGHTYQYSGVTFTAFVGFDLL